MSYNIDVEYLNPNVPKGRSKILVKVQHSESGISDSEEGWNKNALFQIITKRMRPKVDEWEAMNKMANPATQPSILRPAARRILFPSTRGTYGVPPVPPASSTHIMGRDEAGVGKMYAIGRTYTWNGGPNPVGDHKVGYKTRNGAIDMRGHPADKLRWSHMGGPSDIIEFCVM
jgi:hypothetical protein